MLNKSFDQFLCMLHSGLFNNELKLTGILIGWDLLSVAVKNLSFNQFKNIMDYYEKNNLDIDFKKLKCCVVFRRPSKDRRQIESMLINKNKYK